MIRNFIFCLIFFTIVSTMVLFYLQSSSSLFLRNTTYYCGIKMTTMIMFQFFQMVKYATYSLTDYRRLSALSFDARSFWCQLSSLGAIHLDANSGHFGVVQYESFLRQYLQWLKILLCQNFLLKAALKRRKDIIQLTFSQHPERLNCLLY